MSMVKNDQMVETTAKILVQMFGKDHPNQTWPTFIPEADIIVDAIIAQANDPQSGS